MPPTPTADDRLLRAYRDGELVLYLGAGASMASGLPSWEKLVLSMYFAAIAEERVGRPFSNYLYSIAEWHLRNVRQPAAVVARKVRRMFADPDRFTARLRDQLYASVSGSAVTPDRLRATNPTLDAVAGLCASDAGAIEAVISYNYDDLVETVLGHACTPVWDDTVPAADTLPVYHVHGYLPREGGGSDFDQILLTEEQYHRAAHDPYSWSNLVQIRYLASSVGLMVGLSLTDPNMRRLLDALARTPFRVPAFALLQKPKPSQLDDHTLQTIHDQAQEYLELFRRSGAEQNAGLHPGVKGSDWRHEVEQIIHAVERVDIDENERLLRELGVEVVWYDEHDEVAKYLNDLAARERQPALGS